MNNGGSDGIQPGSHHQPPPARRRRVWWIAGIAVLATVLVAAAVIIETHVGRAGAPQPGAAPGPSTSGSAAATSAAAPGPTTIAAADPAAATLQSDFAQFEPTLHANAGIAVGAVGSTNPPISLGDWTSGPAWSTIKIPLALAGLRQDDSHTVTDPMKAAITESDNAAAEAIWATLGGPVDAAAKVQDVLKQTGDQVTSVPSTKRRQEFTIFGQTDWSLTHQVQFISSAVCDNANAPILTLMGQIEPGQSWGIGTITGMGTQFKGGWGPSETGKYLVRQFGLLTSPNGGKIAVALAAEPESGQFDDGTADLTKMAKWLTDHLASLPMGQCGS
jgi:hypothetical protein